MPEKNELLEKLKSNDKNEVREAILQLEGYHDDEVVESIIDAVIRVKAKQVLSAAIDVLLNYQGDKEILAKNAIKLIFTDSPKLRHAGIDILIYCGDKALPYIEKELLNHEDFNIRKYGLDILKEIKTEKSIDLIKKLIEDENPNVKYSAIEYLMNFTKFKDKVVAILKDVIEKERFDSLYGATTIASTIIYGYFLDESLIPILKKKLKEVEDDLIKHWIYKILIYLGDDEIIEEAKENATKVDMEKVIEKDILLAKKM